MSQVQRHLFRFGPYVLNVDQHSLSRGEEQVPLRPKSFQTILYLLKNRHRVVSKNELLDAIWPDVEVTEYTLIHCIKEIRKALLDNVHNPRYVRTIPRVGYRFIEETIEEGGPNLDELSSTKTDNEGQVRARVSHRKYLFFRGLAWGFGILSIALLGIRFWPEETNSRIVRFNVIPPDGMTLDIKGADAGPGALSPDGRHVVYVVTAEGINWLCLHPLDSAVPRVLPGTEGASNPFWSPDSSSVAFFARGQLRRIDIQSAAVQVICNAPLGMGGTWSRDGTIVFAPDFYAPLHSVSASGGTSNPLRKLDEAHREISHRWPVFLPDGRHYLFRVVSPVTHRSGIYVGSLTSETPQFLFNASSNTVYVSPGFLLYLREGTLMAQRFDPETLEIIGQAVPVVDQVDYDPGFSRGAFSVSQEGSLVYSQNSRESRHLAWYDRQGNRVVTVGDKDYYEHFSISPDGTKVALDRRATHSKTTDIWVIDLDLKTTSRFTFDNDVDSFPIWSPDGARIVFSSDRKGSLDLFQKPVAGDHEEELLLSCEAEVRPLDWSSDNRYVLYERTSVDTRSDLWGLPLFGERWRIEGDRLALLEIMLTVLW